MGFIIQCNNKNCREDQEPFLNKETNEVHCSKCGNTISNASVFFKRQMSAFGQVKREKENKQAFSVKCKKCEKILCPQLLEEKGKRTELICPSCKSVHSHLSVPYKQTVVGFLKKLF